MIVAWTKCLKWINDNHPPMRRELSNYKSIADAITLRVYPCAEVVIPGIKNDCIASISNALSGRKAEDTSLQKLQQQELDFEREMIVAYENAGDKGQRIRSISSILRDTCGKPGGLQLFKHNQKRNLSRGKHDNNLHFGSDPQGCGYHGFLHGD